MDFDRPSIEIAQHERIITVSLRGALDLEDQPAATLALSNARTDTGTAGTLLDLAGLTFADSTLLNVMLRAHAEHQAAQRPFVLAGPYHSGVFRLFEITGVTEVLHLADSRAAGMRRIQELLSDSAAAPEDPTP